MDYHGFRSVKEKDGTAYFALITSPPKTATSVEAWTLFTVGEDRVVLDGIISGGAMDPAKYMRDGLDVNYLGKLAAHGYFPDDPHDVPPPVPSLPEYPEGEGGQICFLF